MDTKPTPLLTVFDVAQWLRREPCTIRKWVCYGRIPYLKVGRSVCFERTGIEKWLEPRTSPLVKKSV